MRASTTGLQNKTTHSTSVTSSKIGRSISSPLCSRATLHWHLSQRGCKRSQRSRHHSTTARRINFHSQMQRQDAVFGHDHQRLESGLFLWHVVRCPVGKDTLLNGVFSTGDHYHSAAARTTLVFLSESRSHILPDSEEGQRAKSTGGCSGWPTWIFRRLARKSPFAKTHKVWKTESFLS